MAAKEKPKQVKVNKNAGAKGSAPQAGRKSSDSQAGRRGGSPRAPRAPGAANAGQNAPPGPSAEALEELMAEAAMRDARQAMSDQAADDLSAGAETLSASAQLDDLSQASAAQAARDVSQAADMLAVSERIAQMSALIRAMSLEDVVRGMELAGMSGQVAVVGDVLEQLGMSALATFLDDMSARLKDISVKDLGRASGTRELAHVMRHTSEAVANMSAAEVEDGVTAITTARRAAEARDRAAEAGAEQFAAGLADMAAARGMEAASDELEGAGMGEDAPPHDETAGENAPAASTEPEDEPGGNA